FFVFLCRPASSFRASEGDPLFFVTLSLGKVARDLGESHEGAARVANGRNHDVGPELRSVLPNPPALVFEAAETLGTLQLELTFARSNIRFRVKSRKVLADDLLGGVALEPLGAGIPGGDVTRRIE